MVSSSSTRILRSRTCRSTRNTPSTFRCAHQVRYRRISSAWSSARAPASSTWDPNAVRFGPVTCCWNFLWSAGAAGDARGAYAGVDFVPWWLTQVDWQDQINGARSLDVFDMHAYFGTDISTTGFTKDQLRAETGKYPPLLLGSDVLQLRVRCGLDHHHATQSRHRIPGPAHKGIGERHLSWNADLVHRVGSGTSDEWEFDTALTDADAYGSMGRERCPASPRVGADRAPPTAPPICLTPATSPSSCGPTTTGTGTASGHSPSRTRATPILTCSSATPPWIQPATH